MSKPGSILLVFVMLVLSSTGSMVSAVDLKMQGKIDATSLMQANKLATLYANVRLSFINHDLDYIRAHAFVPKTAPAPSKERAKKFGISLPDINLLVLTKIESKGNLTGMWLLPKKQVGKSKKAYIFRFKKDSKGQWRIHPNTYSETSSDDVKKSAMDLLNSLKI